MAIKAFKDIIDNKGYRINKNDRKIFEEGTLESFFGFGDKDAIEFIIYDANDNQLPQINDELARYIQLNTQNIREYFLISEGTLLQKYQFPNEYFIDVERLLREAGYDNGIFKTQITLLNKRVGSETAFDKLWISEISPSRTEIRLYPLKKGLETNQELQKRFSLFVKNGQFRDDTINFVFNFIEKISPTVIDTFLQNKYTEKWFNKLIGEFKIKDFDIFSQKVYEKFIESAIYEFTNRVSNPTNINYGKSKRKKPDIELSTKQIKDLCTYLLVNCIDFYLSKPDVKKEATFNNTIQTSEDVVTKVLQRLESDTIIDTKVPEKQIGVFTKRVTSTERKDKFFKQIEIVDFPPKEPELPIETGPVKPKPIFPKIIDLPPIFDIVEVPDKDTQQETPKFEEQPKGGGGGGSSNVDVVKDFGTGLGKEQIFVRERINFE